MFGVMSHSGSDGMEGTVMSGMESGFFSSFFSFFFLNIFLLGQGIYKSKCNISKGKQGWYLQHLFFSFF